MKMQTLIIILLLTGWSLVACTDPQDARSAERPSATATTNLPNPASVFCEAHGYTLEIRTAEDGSQQGVCLFPDGSECDEWAYYQGECGPSSQAEAESTPALVPTPEVDTANWVAYTQPTCGFSFRYPPEWTLEEVQGEDNTMSGHQVRLITQAGEGKMVRLLISFKRLGEDQRIWPTGVREGEFIQKGKVNFLGQEIDRQVLVCQDQDLSVYYRQEGGVQRGDLEFAFILDYTGSCLDGFSIPGATQQVADTVVGSFELKE